VTHQRQVTFTHTWSISLVITSGTSLNHGRWVQLFTPFPSSENRHPGKQNSENWEDLVLESPARAHTWTARWETWEDTKEERHRQAWQRLMFHGLRCYCACPSLSLPFPLHLITIIPGLVSGPHRVSKGISCGEVVVLWFGSFHTFYLLCDLKPLSVIVCSS
jgi:hypothetical protein